MRKYVLWCPNKADSKKDNLVEWLPLQVTDIKRTFLSQKKTNNNNVMHYTKNEFYHLLFFLIRMIICYSQIKSDHITIKITNQFVELN